MATLVSTTDNPYNPWTQYELWSKMDASLGYHTPQYVARLYHLADPEQQYQEDWMREQVHQDIVEQNITGTYVLVPEPKENKQILEENMNS